ncbi:hypothetical protein [Baaleninema sp.]|uniref:hypothetical protein n=1 Tax=Baaleninema sp. TaxID=3101197 RepID=UPI003D0659A4
MAAAINLLRSIDRTDTRTDRLRNRQQPHLPRGRVPKRAIGAVGLDRGVRW